MPLQPLVTGGDMNFQNLLPTQGSQNFPSVSTIASAATIAPTTYLTKLTGSVAVNTITPPLQGSHQLMIVFTGTVGSFGTSGNILVGVATPVSNVPNIFQYDPTLGKYFVK